MMLHAQPASREAVLDSGPETGWANKSLWQSFSEATAVCSWPHTVGCCLAEM